ncbi:helix-turn-helix transcriptional regulator [Chitinilyticum litopenaei]|uniref:helix-turn-helix transcriptional regulator n=1 Tax=Chitinilyticum litopenaei TaxID=1121276 RepID=UPI00048ED924|nr:AlpA family transcriptional regulator [Chitinilyticum litopenaei]
MAATAQSHSSTHPAKLDRFVRLPEVRRITGLCTTTIYARIARNEFPKQISCGGRAVAWLESDLIAWQQRILDQQTNKN